MFTSFTQIDTPLEYLESAVAVALFLVGLGMGSWLGKFIYGLLLLGLLAIPIWEISNGLLSGWKSISLGSAGLGLIIGIVLFPLSNAYKRIEALEKKIKADENSGE